MKRDRSNPLPGSPQPIESDRRRVPLSDLPPHRAIRRVREEEREGVFVHSFKCGHCSLHFLTFSWQANRHRVGSIRCPECGHWERLTHWRATLSESRQFELSAPNEIYALHPWPGSVLLDDSTL